MHAYHGGGRKHGPCPLRPATDAQLVRYNGRRAPRELDEHCHDRPDQILVEAGADAQQGCEGGQRREHAQSLHAAGLPDLDLRCCATNAQLVRVEDDLPIVYVRVLCMYGMYVWDVCIGFMYRIYVWDICARIR